MINKSDILSVQKISNLVRLHVLNMTSTGRSSHVGSALSIVDILSVLYGHIMSYDPKNPKLQSRDRFILSKGHAGAAVYATLAEFGFFDVSKLKDHYQNGSIFSGHVSHKGVPGVELSTGSLGHGLGVGVGMALALLQKSSSSSVYVLASDGELDEGSNWEAILFAAHHSLSNITLIIDYNKLQSLTFVSETLSLEPLSEKFSSFNWSVFNVDGHHHQSLIDTFIQAKSSKGPSVIICHTTKGKGVSFMENSVLWHYRNAQGLEYKEAFKELSLLNSSIESL